MNDGEGQLHQAGCTGLHARPQLQGLRGSAGSLHQADVPELLRQMPGAQVSHFEAYAWGYPYCKDHKDKKHHCKHETDHKMHQCTCGAQRR